MEHSKRILVVGGASGIGLSMATLWAREKGVEQVYIIDKAPLDPEYQQPKIRVVQFDLTSSDYSIFDGFTDVDIVMITAGFGRLALFRDIPEELIRASFEVNTLPAMRIVKRFYHRRDRVGLGNRTGGYRICGLGICLGAVKGGSFKTRL